MINLILNRDFKLPEDGWYQIAPLGEFPHAAAGIVQVLDREACDAMAATFVAEAAKPNFPGLLVDFDHFSLDAGQRSEAAGWIVALDARLSGQSAVRSEPFDGAQGRQSGDTGQRAVGNGQPLNAEAGRDGLWANIRWSDVGRAAVEGGRYRFLSPVWARADCVELGENRFRPIRLLNAAVTNDPNLKGILPLSNRNAAENVDRTPLCRDLHCSEQAQQKENHMKLVIEKLVNHLGLPADASEVALLAAMKELPAVAAHAQLQNSLRELQGKHDALVADVGKLEQELVNRHLADFEGVITDSAKAFWSEQLLANRESALQVLGDLKASKQSAVGSEPFDGAQGRQSGTEQSVGSTKKPLHNRAAARPVQPGVKTESDGKAVRMRNRAHEIVRSEGVPFSVAFRRAEKEVSG